MDILCLSDFGTVILDYCASLPQPNTGQLVLSANRTIDSIATLTCFAGYEIAIGGIGRELTGVCWPNRTWSIPVTSCVGRWTCCTAEASKIICSLRPVTALVVTQSVGHYLFSCSVCFLYLMFSNKRYTSRESSTTLTSFIDQSRKYASKLLYAMT